MRVYIHQATPTVTQRPEKSRFLDSGVRSGADGFSWFGHSDGYNLATDAASVGIVLFANPARSTNNSTFTPAPDSARKLDSSLFWSHA